MRKIITSLFLALTLSPIANAHEIKIDVDELATLNLASQWCTNVYEKANEQQCIAEAIKQVKLNNSDSIDIVQKSCKMFDDSDDRTSCERSGFSLLSELVKKNPSSVE